MSCLDIVVVCRCVSSTDVFFYCFSLVWNANTFLWIYIYIYIYIYICVFLFVCEGKNIFSSLLIIDVVCVLLACRYMIVHYNVLSLVYKCMIWEKNIEIWYLLKLFLALYLGEVVMVVKWMLEYLVSTCFIVCVRWCCLVGLCLSYL
jgi:hypothetical protein